MALNYETTNWENGKTVLRAEHLRKIEKGITDIISENDAIYKDEDTRKSNEKQRQEEHLRKMNEVSGVVSDIQKDYDSLQKIIIDENASANLQKQINSVNSQLEQNMTKVNEQFNTINTVLLMNINHFKLSDDLDYTQAFIRAINCNPKGATIYIPQGRYKIKPDLIKLKSNIHLIGLGYPTLYTEEGQAYEFMLGNHDEDILQNITIEGLCFDQSYEVGKFEPTLNNKPTRGISFKNIKNLKIINNTFTNFMGQHCIIVNETPNSNSSDIFIDNNNIEVKRLGYPSSSDFYDQSAIYVESDGHIITNNIITSIETNYDWWELPGGIETHGSKGVIENNTITNTMIAINITPHWWKVNRVGKRIINNNNLVNCCEGIVFWSSADITEGGNGIHNVDITNNFISLKSSKNILFGCAIGTTNTDNGEISNINIKNNTIQYVGDTNNYKGTLNLSPIDMSAFRFYNKNTMCNVKIENNIIKKYGGCVLGISQVNIPQSNIHNNFSFTNNTVEDCTYYEPESIWNVSMFFLNYVKDIEIHTNKIKWSNDVSYPNEYGASHIFISDHISNLEYYDNKYYYDNYFNIFVNMNNYRERETIQINFNYLRQLRDNEFKVINSKRIPVKGTFVIGDIFANYHFEDGFEKWTNFKNGTYGNSQGTCNVLNTHKFELTSSNKFDYDTFVECGSVVCPIIVKNKNSYFTNGTLSTGNSVSVKYSVPDWEVKSV